VLRRRLEILLLAALLALGLFFLPRHWRADAAAAYQATATDGAEHAKRAAPRTGQRPADRRAPGPSIDPYVRPEFAAEMPSYSQPFWRRHSAIIAPSYRI